MIKVVAKQLQLTREKGSGRGSLEEKCVNLNYEIFMLMPKLLLTHFFVTAKLKKYICKKFCSIGLRGHIYFNF